MEITTDQLIEQLLIGTMSLAIKLPSGNTAILISWPMECPFCHNRITPKAIGTTVLFKNKLSVVFHCPNDEDCSQLFVAYYIPSDKAGQWKLENVMFGKHADKIFHKSIEEVSPSFVQIYNQAFSADKHDLKEICGVGYRKSLEFLVKDYAKKYNPDSIDEIEKIPLQQVINKFIKNNEIKEVASRAVWLGNDEAHYVRKWIEKDLEDLKDMIDLTITFIRSSFDYKKLVASMPSKVNGGTEATTQEAT